ncbi:MgtC/SapB family protein [Aquincola sp. S2]|uniref:Protein MgtC n=1 Tax=Pseudaquabacterium terrae TaxID=2732868 RepID=A0ABX2EHX7_9BURK|nr:MgtC/SapB family protein [Aquabacterium terrae]NRF68176.1 MgtC/SapB family protein [Aquabacterium terrae]
MTVFDTVIATLRSEFSDLADIAHLTQLLVRLLLAALLGGLLGYERERQGKAAGVRTHMLVAIGAAMLVLVPLQAGMPLADLSRVVQGIVTGIGFLGAGAIIKHASREGPPAQDQDQVQGLTTAAGVWMTAAIGIACGMGRDTTAVAATLIALVILALIPRPTERRDGR